VKLFMKRRVFTKSRVLVIAVGLILGAGAFLLWPAYTNPQSRLYASAIGFLKIQRFLGMPFEAEAEHPVLHDFETPVLGEGTIQCNFYNVPIVPTARVEALHVEEGDEVKEDQLLAELNETEATLSLNSAELGVASAAAERQRVEAGSVNALAAERPEKDRASLEGLGKVVKEAEAKVEMYRKLNASGAASRLELVNAEIELANAQTSYAEAQISVGMSTQGLPQSKEIAQNAINDAQNLLQLRQEALKYYRVTAPTAGVIDRVLIRHGEYNQNAGNTGFIIASGMWFEANIDQRAVAYLREGMEATVNLEAYAGRSFRATVERIIPIVTFNAGGPDTTSPVRPLGTGSPEWPATFKVRLHLDAPGVKLTPGMTGFARVIARHRRALAVPRDALTSLSAGKGVVRLADSSDRLVTTPVSLGEVDTRFVEITGGLDPSDWVLTNSPRFLRDDDKIHITRLTPLQQTEKNGKFAAGKPDTLKAQPKDIEAKVQQAEKNGQLAASELDALRVHLKDAEARLQQAQKNGELAANQRDELQAQLKDTEAKLERTQKSANLVTSQRDELQSRLREIETRAQLTQNSSELRASQGDAPQTQLKDSLAQVQQAQKNAELAAGERAALQAQLKEAEAKAQQAQKNGELVAGERAALQAQLKEAEAKAQQVQKNGEQAAGERDALQGQLKEAEASAQQAQRNGELVAGERAALQAQLKEAEAKAQEAQRNGEIAASQRAALQARLMEAEAETQQVQKNGELVAGERAALQAQLKEAEAKAQQAQRNGELVANQRDSLQARLNDSEARAQQAQKDAELVANQRDSLQARLNDSEARAQQAQKSAEFAASQRDALQARLNNEAKAQLAARDAALSFIRRETLQTQPKTPEEKAQTGTDSDLTSARLTASAEVQQEQNKAISSGAETGPSAVEPNPIPKGESVTQDQEPATLDPVDQDQTAPPQPTQSVAESRESRKGRHAIRHKTASRRYKSSDPVSRWLERHLNLSLY
jgi:multidrug efflux pump subunit AcrA (membrane-fusion protein)